MLVVTTFHLDEYVHEALRAGAAGFLLKDPTAPDSLVEAVRTVASGDALLSPAVTRQLIEPLRAAPPTPDAELTGRLAELTPRELDVTRLVARGMTNAEIAGELFLVCEGTVKTHVTRDPLEARAAQPHPAVVAAVRIRLVMPRTRRRRCAVGAGHSSIGRPGSLFPATCRRARRSPSRHVGELALLVDPPGGVRPAA